MITSTWLLHGAAIPALLCAAVVFLAGLVLRAHPWVVTGWAWPVAIASGFAVGYYATDGWPPLPPTESQHWLICVVVPLALIDCIVIDAFESRKSLQWVSKILLAAGTPPLLLQSYLQYSWQLREATIWLGSLSVAILLLWWLLDHLRDRAAAPGMMWILVLNAGATGLVLMVSGSNLLGQLGLAFAATLLGGSIASLALPRDLAAPASTGLIVLILAGLWLNGYFYAELTPLNALLLAGAPLAAWITQAPVISQLTGLKLLFIRLAIVAGPLLVALVLATIKFNQAMSDPW